MFCPKCATQNVDGASFCRSCGANISLIPHALSGRLPEAPRDDARARRRKKRDRDVEPSVEKGILNVFIGIGFIVAALAVMLRFPAGIFWGWCFFIPGFSSLGRGVASIVAARRQSATQLPNANTGAVLPNPYSAPQSRIESGVPRTSELMPPATSVTEGTTRHLGAEAPTRTFDSRNDQSRS